MAPSPTARDWRGGEVSASGPQERAAQQKDPSTKEVKDHKRLAGLGRGKMDLSEP